MVVPSRSWDPQVWTKSPGSSPKTPFGLAKLSKLLWGVVRYPCFEAQDAKKCSKAPFLSIILDVFLKEKMVPKMGRFGRWGDDYHGHQEQWGGLGLCRGPLSRRSGPPLERPSSTKKNGQWNGGRIGPSNGLILWLINDAWWTWSVASIIPLYSLTLSVIKTFSPGRCHHCKFLWAKGHGERVGARQHWKLFRLGLETRCQTARAPRRALEEVKFQPGFSSVKNGPSDMTAAAMCFGCCNLQNAKELLDDFEEKKQKLKKRGTMKLVRM